MSIKIYLASPFFNDEELKNIETAENSLRMLMGEETEPRRDFLFKNVDFSILNR